MDLLDEYEKLFGCLPGSFARIRRKKEEGGVYYFELNDMSYISVLPNPMRKAYDCIVLDSDKNFEEGKYNFVLPFEYVSEVGSFESALENVYNKAVKSVISGDRDVTPEGAAPVRQEDEDE